MSEQDLNVRKRRNRGPISEKVDVAIIGTGTGGLTAGAYLAKRGFKVACFDQHYLAGGCATQFPRGRKDQRYHFDVGLHYVGDCGPTGMIPRLLQGVGAEVEFNEMDPNGFDMLHFPDFRFGIPASIDLYRDRLVEQFPKEKRGIDRYVSFVRQIEMGFKMLSKSNRRLTFGIMLTMLLKGRLAIRYQGATLKDVLDSCTQNQQLRAIICGQHGDYALPPSEVSALLHGGLAAHYFGGAYYPKGGGQVISDRLAEIIESEGGEIHLSCGIDKILVENGKAVGLRTEERHGEVHEIKADSVISNADLQKTLLELLGPEHLPAKWVNRAENFTMTPGCFMTCLGIETDMRAKGMGPSNYLQYDDYDVEGWYQKVRNSQKPVITGAYITSASLKDPHTPSHAPEGITNLEIMTLVSTDPKVWGVSEAELQNWGYKRNAAYQNFKAELEEESIRRLEVIFPDTAKSIVYRESASPLTQNRYTRGTAYGIACTPDQFEQKRPGFRGPIPSLYLCGHSLRAAHGILGAMSSGYQAARRVAKDGGRPLPAV
jgi:all-trans-retinol 13,14-reductase